MIGRFFALVSLLLAVACSRPGSYEEFVKAEDAPGGVYEFVLPGGTSVIPSAAKEPATYDLSFYTAPLAEPLQLEITWPEYRETVWFPAGQHQALYRSGVRFAGAEASPSGSSLRSPHHPSGTVPPLSNRGCYVPEGEASAPVAVVLQVRPVNPPADFRGLGIIIKRNDGTR